MFNKNFAATTAAALVIILTLVVFFVWGRQNYDLVEPKPLPAPPSVNMTTLAQCLKDRGVVMYGAEWCPHCQNQKKLFGESFGLVPYVECPADPNKCVAAGIQGYPTWIFPDGQKLVGEQTLEKLAETSGCAL